MSTKTSEDMRKKTDSIDMSVGKLEMINDALLSKMFGMVDKTLADYREHEWTGKASEEDFSKLAEKKVDERIKNLRSGIFGEIEATISDFGKKTKKTDAEISEIKKSMEDLLGKAINDTRQIEKDTELEAMKNRILLGLLILLQHKGIKNCFIIFFTFVYRHSPSWYLFTCT